MIDSFMYQAFFAGLGVILLSGPLGCILVWNRMAYFGDSLTHSSVLGISIGLILDLNISVAVIVTAACFAIIISLLSEYRQVSTDLYLGILAHTSFSAGILLLGVMDVGGIDIHAFLFGDILTVTNTDIAIIYAVDAVVCAVLFKIWNPILRMSLHEGIAASEGLNVRMYRTLQMILIAVVIGVSIRITGILLITAFLIIPASAARFISKSPTLMGLNSILFGLLALISGLVISYYFDAPTGPAIIVAAAGIFFLTFLFLRKER